jgi:hypothetical protein
LKKHAPISIQEGRPKTRIRQKITVSYQIPSTAGLHTKITMDQEVILASTQVLLQCYELYNVLSKSIQQGGLTIEKIKNK